MKTDHLVIRNFEAGAYLESFLVSAVLAVLVIRLFLELTGYPQIGGGGLHIAHMLWGGVLMLAGLIILLAFLGRRSARTAAVLGGTGFGTFIDEIGKFITSNNDYFFQPAVALIYVTFILLFILTRALHTRRNYTAPEYLANALREMEEVAAGNLDAEEQRRALSYLEKSLGGDGSINDNNTNAPLVIALREVLTRTELRAPEKMPLLAWAKKQISRFYYYVAALWWFPKFVIGFFVIQLLIKAVYVFVLIFVIGLGWQEILDVRVVSRIAGRMLDLSFVDKAEIAFWLLSGFFVLYGVLKMRRSRIAAYRQFERSILVSIFLTQVFAFYQEQFSALFGFILNVMILVALRFMIEQEQAAASV